MQTDSEPIRVFNKAQNLAYWSFIGFFIPLAGIIIGLISRSMIKTLKPTTENEAWRINRVRHTAAWGIAISFVLTAVVIVYGVIWAIDYSKTTDQIQQAVDQYNNTINSLGTGSN